MIPLELVQSAANKNPDPKITKLITTHFGNKWAYRYFSNADMLQYFRDNPLPGFENIEQKWHAMPTGAHKADLFRYYFLYINGGVYLDYDAMVYSDLSNYCDQYEFFTVITNDISMCNGLIGCCPLNLIVKDLLNDVYQIDVNVLKNCYGLLCENLSTIVHNHLEHKKVFLFREMVFDQLSIIVDKSSDNNPIAVHYYQDKIVPEVPPEDLIQNLLKKFGFMHSLLGYQRPSFNNGNLLYVDDK
jgi:hypothetical protein